MYISMLAKGDNQISHYYITINNVLKLPDFNIAGISKIFSKECKSLYVL